MRDHFGRLVIDEYIIRQRDYSLMGKIFDMFTEISVEYDKRRNAFIYYGYSDEFDTLEHHENIPDYIFIENEYGEVSFLRVNREV
jgi:hypothetical protein